MDGRVSYKLRIRECNVVTRHWLLTDGEFAGGMGRSGATRSAVNLLTELQSVRSQWHRWNTAKEVKWVLGLELIDMIGIPTDETGGRLRGHPSRGARDPEFT